MNAYVVLNNETFSALSGCLILLPTADQEKEYEAALENGDIHDLVHDQTIRRIALTEDLIAKLMADNGGPT